MNIVGSAVQGWRQRMSKSALTVHFGKGTISLASAIVDDIPSIIIEPIANPLPIGTKVPSDAARTDFPIVLYFHSADSIKVWRKQLDAVEKILNEEAENESSN